MSAPRTKRQFAGAASDPAQRQIREFFKPAGATGGDSTPPSDLASGPLSPPLPGAVQANLLSVGMRVRKSVPEGYKTGSKMGGFSLWSDNSTPGQQQQHQQQQQLSGDFRLPTSSFVSQQESLSTFSSRRELLPFCGINKVGGLAVQPDAPPFPTSFFSPATIDKPAIAVSSAPDLDDLPGLTSSQDSIASTVSSSPPQVYVPYPAAASRNNKKRTYADDVTLPVPVPGAASANPDIVWRHRRDWIDGEISPRSLAPVGWEKNARVMAVPRGLRKAAAAAVGDGAARDQENRLASFAVVGEMDDFEEAEFLDYMEVEEE